MTKTEQVLSRLQVQDATQADDLTAVQLLSDAGGIKAV